MLILYAEDDFSDFDFFFEAIKTIDPSIECVNTRDGQETLEFLEQALVIPDFIFLDVKMPNMDGKKCLKILRQVDALKKVPIIMYTKSIDERDKWHCKELGATDYTRKPLTMREAVDKLRGFIVK